MAQKKDRRTLSKKRKLEDRGALPKEEGDLIIEYKAMHEENFLSSCLEDDTEGKLENVAKGIKKKTLIVGREGWKKEEKR